MHIVRLTLLHSAPPGHVQHPVQHHAQTHSHRQDLMSTNSNYIKILQNESSNRKLEKSTRTELNKMKNKIYRLGLQAAPAADSSEIEHLTTLVDTTKVDIKHIVTRKK